MKTPEDYKKFHVELKALCDKYGIGILGTCEGEGVYGEITMFDREHPESSGWANPLSRIDGEIYPGECGGFYITGA